MTNWKGIIGALVAWLAVCAGAAAGQSVSLAWTATADPSTAGYAVYCGCASGSYASRIDVGTNTTATIASLKEGRTNYFTVTAYNVAGVESLPASEVAYIVPGVLALTRGVNPGDPATIRFPVAPTHWYEVQASTDMKSWATIQRTTTATINKWASVLDPQSGAFPVRYYRLVLH